MSALTSKTFQYEPSFSALGLVRSVADVAVSGGRLLARLFMSPPRPTVRSHAAEAAEVRAMARTWEKTDPGFASDLYAAAARHEGLPD
jgi:hypothetical protein